MTIDALTTDRILPTTKISEVLRSHPELLEVLIEQSPSFSKLRNPVLRRIQARLVSVEQAARIAGLEPAALVRALNAAIGGEPLDLGAASASVPAGPPPPWVGTAPIAAELDARPFHRRGEEPFGAIMAAVAQVQQGAALKLRNSFDPLPLYDVLGKRGFVGWGRQLGQEDWEILFFNEGRQVLNDRKQPAAAAPPEQPVQHGDQAEPSGFITIDVSELVPPEPMMKILGALEALEPGGTLLVHHVRRPIHLHPRLDELGYVHTTRELEDGRIELRIHKPQAGAGAE